MAKEGGYLSKHGIEAELIHIPPVAAIQALIAGKFSWLKLRSLDFGSNFSGRRRENRGEFAQSSYRFDFCAAGNKNPPSSSKGKRSGYRDLAR